MSSNRPCVHTEAFNVNGKVLEVRVFRDTSGAPGHTVSVYQNGNCVDGIAPISVSDEESSNLQRTHDFNGVREIVTDIKSKAQELVNGGHIHLS